MTGALIKASQQFPVVSLTGPRQSGKTTLVKKIFPNMVYVSLENPDTLEYALTDPRAFLRQAKDGMIIDEAQRAPELFSYIQGIVDEAGKNGMYVLTGSQNFLLLANISQSLAGRVAIFKLLPFSVEEYGSAFKIPSIEELLLKGMYPRIHTQKLEFGSWFESYITTYLERDVRNLKNIGNLYTFQKFLKLCAGRSGQILNYSSLANDCGISHNTARSWISILEASFIVSILPPYYENFNKRLVKSPKLYFLDTGLLCHLLGIHNVQHYSVHPLRGAVFETFVFSELLKIFLHRGLKKELYYWRDKTGHEIDFVIPLGEKKLALEVKAGKTVHSDFFRNLNFWKKLGGGSNCFILYNGTLEQNRQAGHILPVFKGLELLALLL